jgi:peptide-methionine (R)-S-oxide reductase
LEKINKSDSEWKEILSEEEFRVTRKKGTEPPFRGEYNNNKNKGTYTCRCCGLPLFDSDTKYDSGSGWPSFFAPLEEDNIEEHRDLSHGMIRTEVTCKRCGCHLGHLFTDGPKPTGLRYCINSVSLKFEEDN